MDNNQLDKFNAKTESLFATLNRPKFVLTLWALLLSAIIGLYSATDSTLVSSPERLAIRVVQSTAAKVIVTVQAHLGLKVSDLGNLFERKRFFSGLWLTFGPLAGNFAAPLKAQTDERTEEKSGGLAGFSKSLFKVFDPVDDPDYGLPAGGEPPVDGETTAGGESPVDGETTAGGEPPVDGETTAGGEPPVDGETTASGEPPVDGETTASGEPPVDGATTASGEPPVDGETTASGELPVDQSSDEKAVNPVPHPLEEVKALLREKPIPPLEKLEALLVRLEATPGSEEAVFALVRAMSARDPKYHLRLGAFFDPLDTRPKGEVKLNLLYAYEEYSEAKNQPEAQEKIKTLVDYLNNPEAKKIVGYDELKAELGVQP
jgi:hypothetical protein